MEEETKASEAAGELFRGHQFYLARALRPERRAEMRLLISQNGGEVVREPTGGAVEIVERHQLKPGENWVAADFIEDSVRDGQLKLVVEYMALAEERPKRTPSGRPLKKFFTVEERAKMLQFLHDQYPKYYNTPSVPARVWKHAEELKLLDRTAQSMHEHYRRQLVLLTKKERALIFEHVGMRNLDSDERPQTRTAANRAEKNGEAASAVKTVKRRRRSQSKSVGEGEGVESEEDIRGRAKKRTKRSTAVRTEQVNEAAPEERGNEEDVEQPRPSSPRVSDSRVSEDVEDEDPEEQAKEEQVLDEETPQERAKDGQKEAEAEQERADQEEEQAEEEQKDAEEELKDAEGEQEQAAEEKEPEDGDNRSGEIFRSYWREVVSDRSLRAHLDRFFVPPPPPTTSEVPQSTIFNSTTTSWLRTPQRLRRLSRERSVSLSTPTPQKGRRNRRASSDSLHTPGQRSPAQAAQQELLSQLEEMVGQRMTPPSRRKSLDHLILVTQANDDTADELLSQLRFITGHDLNTLCSALYWAGGNTNVARDFLLGHSPPEMWTPTDDSLLADYMRGDITEADIANARYRGAFERMSTKRSARDIVRRIHFLL